jgi:hypothetical protein
MSKNNHGKRNAFQLERCCLPSKRLSASGPTPEIEKLLPMLVATRLSADNLLNGSEAGVFSPRAAGRFQRHNLAPNSMTVPLERAESRNANC